MKKTLEWFNGKKLIIGAVLYLIVEGIDALFPGTIPPEVGIWLRKVINLIMGVGLTHKTIKKYYGTVKKGVKDTGEIS